MHKSTSVISFFMGKSDENSCMQLTDTKGECQRVRGNASALPALNHSRMMKVSLCMLRLSVTELTSSLLFYNWNPRLSVCHVEKKTNKHTCEFDEVLLRGHYVPKNAESLSIKNRTPYGYGIMPSSVHLQMQIGEFLEEGLDFPQRKVCFC